MFDDQSPPTRPAVSAFQGRRRAKRGRPNELLGHRGHRCIRTGIQAMATAGCKVPGVTYAFTTMYEALEYAKLTEGVVH